MTVPGDTAFRALADPQRRRILGMLRSGELPAGEIAQRLALTPATASHHLAQLRGAGLVRVRRDGQQRIYTLNTSVVEEVMLLVKELLSADKETSK